MTRARFRLAARTVSIITLIRLALPAPVAADNCSGLSDCGNTLELLLLIVIGVLIVVLIVLAAGEMLAVAAAAEAAEAAAALAAEEAAAAAAEAAAAAAEEAAAAAAEEAAAAAAEEVTNVSYGPLDPRSWVEILNGGEGAQNCGALTIEMANGFAGDTIPAAVSGLEGVETATEAAGMATEVLEAEMGSTFVDATAASIENAIGQAGEQGIVRVTEGGFGHVFNAMNIDGEVWYLDAQSGTISQSLAEVMGASGYSGGSNIFFMPL